MSVTCARTVINNFTGDVSAEMENAAASNTTSPGQIEIVALSSGSNTVTVVTGAIAVTIIPPSGNTVLMTLKGVTGDTGIPLHKTDPTSIGLDTTATTFCLTAAAAISSVRLVWS